MNENLILLAISIVSLTLSCEYFSLKSFKEWEKITESTETVIYSAGHYENPAGTYHACYWENTNFYDLKDNSNSSEARSIFVQGDDIYTAGYCDGRACLSEQREGSYEDH